MNAALSRLLGLEPDETQALVAIFVRRRGRPAFGVRALALVVAASRPGRVVLPRSVRVRAIRPFLYELLWGPAENLIYVGRERLGERP
jgi:hypothetical protein